MPLPCDTVAIFVNQPANNNTMYNDSVKREIGFVCLLLRKHRNECAVIGRDLVRAMCEAARIPEIEQIWSEWLRDEGTEQRMYLFGFDDVFNS